MKVVAGAAENCLVDSGRSNAFGANSALGASTGRGGAGGEGACGDETFWGRLCGVMGCCGAWGRWILAVGGGGMPVR